MTARAKAAPEGSRHLRLEHRARTLLGWSLVFGFAIAVATWGRIGANVRGFQLAYILGFVGYALVLRAVHLSAHSGQGIRWWLFGCLAVRVIVVAVEPSDDAYRYLWEGRVQRAGFNPFVMPPNHAELTPLRDDDWSRINHPDYPAIYGPVAQAEFLVAATVYPSIYTLKVLHVTWDALTVLVLAACLRRRNLDPRAAVIYGLCPLVITSFAIEGHVDSLMLLLVASTVWATMAKRWHLAGAVLGLAIATKMVAVVLLPWFVFRHRRSAATAVAILLLCYGPYFSAGADLLTSLARFGSSGEFLSLLGTFRITTFDTALSRNLTAALLVLVVSTLAWRRRSFVAFAAGAFEALILLMPIVHYWYLSWMLLVMPFAVRVRWWVAALLMVGYFEANKVQETTGEWVLPFWPRLVVWIGFLAAVLLERLRQPAPSGFGQEDSDRLVDARSSDVDHGPSV